MQQIGEIAKKHAYTNKKEKSKTSISMLRKFGRPLKLRQWVNAMTYTSELMYSC